MCVCVFHRQQNNSIILNSLTIVIKDLLEHDPLTYYLQNLPEKSFQSEYTHGMEGKEVWTWSL